VPAAAAYRPPAQASAAAPAHPRTPHVAPYVAPHVAPNRSPSGVHAGLSAPPIPRAIPVTPPIAGGDTRRGPTSSFDMATRAAREAAVRRLVWIIVLVVAAGVGFVLATQL
jgi:hypothetical protein